MTKKATAGTAAETGNGNRAQRFWSLTFPVRITGVTTSNRAVAGASMDAVIVAWPAESVAVRPSASTYRRRERRLK